MKSQFLLIGLMLFSYSASADNTVIGGGGGMSAPAGYTSRQLIWDENFGSFDATKWYQDMRDVGRPWSFNLPAPYTSQGNGTDVNAAYDDPAQLSYGTNGLTITATPSNTFSPYTWKSGTISTGTKWLTPAKGCYIQFKVKTPDVRYGAWPALWFFQGTPAWEFDVYEGGFYLNGDSSDPTPLNQIVSTTLQSGQGKIQSNVGVDMSAGFHIFGVEYIPGVSFKVYVDGVLKGTWNKNVPRTRYPIIIDLQMGQNHDWAPNSDPANHSGPFQFIIQEMQVYSR